MASSEDFKRILELYNQEAKASGISIVTFCQKNGIVYSQFERWYKNRNKVKVHAVEVVNQDNRMDTSQQSNGSQQEVLTTCRPLFTIQIKSNTGMYFQQKNISYTSLKELVEKLEVLC